MYELVILSLLMRTPMHGYLIANVINAIIGPYARVSNGRLYPLLAKLEESGLIEANEDAGKEQRSEHNSRGYRITETGRKRFHALMLDTTSNPGEYQRLFRQKVTVLYLLKPAERLYLIDHYINYCQTHVLHLTAEGEDLATGHYHHTSGENLWLPATLGVMEHMGDQWRLEVAWALRLREQEQARQQTLGLPQGERPDSAALPDRPTRNQNQNQNQNQNHNRNRNQN